jgi:hypothetical protein
MSDQPPASVADAHVWEVERLLDKLRAEEEGHRNFPLIQALEALLGRLPVEPSYLESAAAPGRAKRRYPVEPEK